MPRTKKFTRSSKTRSKFSTSSVKTKQEPKSSIDGPETMVSLWISSFDKDYKTELFNFENRHALVIEEIDQIAFEECTLASTINSKKTLKELRTEKSFNNTNMKSFMYDTASLMKHLNGTTNSTLTVPKKKKQTDEGYLTAGESGNAIEEENDTASVPTSTRKRSSSVQRSRPPPTKAVPRPRRSRSLSRVKSVTIQAPEKATPDKAMKPPLTFGMVTPKVKPNMPVSIYRHAEQGEMALSLQGSPLLVNTVISKDYANVNIPLLDGRVMNMQPNRGLRMSEIPQLDEDTCQQLLALRDNIDKVVTMVNKIGS